MTSPFVGNSYRLEFPYGLKKGPQADPVFPV
jgi:hypothetical protein